MMSFVSTLGRVVTTTLVLVTFLSHEQRMVFAEQAKNTNNNEKMDTLTLVNKPIESLASLSSGVFLMELAQGVRPGCGGSTSDQGMYEPLFSFIRIIVFILYMYLP
jgi:hypothetical protein